VRGGQARTGRPGRASRQRGGNEGQRRSGWTFNKSVVYGLFHTNTFNIGSPKVNNDRPNHSPVNDDITRYTTANQGFHFTQYDLAGDSIDVQCLASLNVKTAQYSNLLSDEISNIKYEMHLSKNISEKAFLTYKKERRWPFPSAKTALR